MKTTLDKSDIADLTELLKATWNNSESMVKHCLKSSKHIRLTDGRFVDVGSAKPSISKDLYYDDETDAPNTDKFEVFKAYNIRNAQKHYESLESHNFGRVSTLALYPQYHGDKTNGQLLGVGYREESQSRVENVTPELLTVINKTIDELRADYEKRLATYWKRYSNKVHAVGYWANR